jgi:release factor glutamine methyltransferase
VNEGDRRNDLAGLSIAAARRDLARQFRTAGLASPELDARLLIGDALDLDLTGINLATARILRADEAAAIARSAQRRLRGEPIARIVGHKEFWGLSLRLNADTLVPRADTETLVEVALESIRGRKLAIAAPEIADIGTGSGAIMLALLSELPQAQGIATDISLAALRVARDNARDLGLAGRVSFVVSDYLAAIAGPFDLIVANPPYIRSADIATLDIDVRDHDPRRALDGGSDGLAAYRRLASESISRLAPQGTLAVEVGHDQADEVAGIMQAAGLDVMRPHRRDLGGISRVVAGRRSLS